jgi:hypothetical protein
MLDEDITVSQPRYNKLLVQRALHLLDSYPGVGMTRLAVVLNDTAANDRQIDPVAYPAIESKIGGGGRAAVTALDLLAAWAELPGNVSIRARSRIERLKKNTPTALAEAIEHLKQFSPREIWFDYYTSAGPREPEHAAGVFAGHLRASDLPVTDQSRLVSIVRHLADGKGDLTDLDGPRLQELLVAAVEGLDLVRWPQGAEIQRTLIHWYARRPIVGKALTTLVKPGTGSAAA